MLAQALICRHLGRGELNGSPLGGLHGTTACWWLSSGAEVQEQSATELKVLQCSLQAPVAGLTGH